VILIADLLAIAQAKLNDATVLFINGRTAGAEYVCGYAVELVLKARICKTLNWSGFPEKRIEFENYASFRTHKLDVLLALSGEEQRIKADHILEWSHVAKWNPEVRYSTTGTASRDDVALMISSTETLLRVL
jgi:hypothetical protein